MNFTFFTGLLEKLLKARQGNIITVKVESLVEDWGKWTNEKNMVSSFRHLCNV